ncbi:MAG: hypothetical protein ACLPHP_05855 [Candidatus Sulfotelmatobacter sp.]
MKRHEGLLFLFALLLPISSALAQTATPQPAREVPKQIADARCAYTAMDDACTGASPGTHDAVGNGVLAQLPRRGPGPSFGPRGPMGRPAYPAMWGQPEPSGRHALVGAVIGGLLGWAVATKGNAGARATFGLATVGAGLGASHGLVCSVLPFPEPLLASLAGR